MLPRTDFQALTFGCFMMCSLVFPQYCSPALLVRAFVGRATTAGWPTKTADLILMLSLLG